MTMNESTLSRLLFGCPVVLGACVLVWLLARQPQETSATPDDAMVDALSAQDPLGARANLGYADRLARVRLTVPPGHVVVSSPPFIVVGDQPREVVTRHVAENVHWAARQLKQLYFERDPVRPIEIWLLGTPDSYARATEALFGEPPSTPYGFFVAEQGTMVMNIQTGGGTLVHELVHAYMAANFPGCPAWLNEGLGALYEMVGEKNGRIWGFVNWRLPVLQEAIAQGRVVPLPKLLALAAEQFYSDPTGLHYSEARYLLYYLQANGLLVRFYKRFRARWQEENASERVLREVLDGEALAVFQRRWESFVRGLKVRYEVQVSTNVAQVRTFEPTLER